MAASIQLEASWLKHLAPEFEKPYMRELRAFLGAEKAAGVQVFPPGAEIFNAFAHTPLERTRVVILGQDPYHGPGQAHGLCFSVRPGVATPPSLQNIFKEIERDLGIVRPAHGSLIRWADQGVLLLNSVLTVAAGRRPHTRARDGSSSLTGWWSWSTASAAALSSCCGAATPSARAPR